MIISQIDIFLLAIILFTKSLPSIFPSSVISLIFFTLFVFRHIQIRIPYRFLLIILSSAIALVNVSVLLYCLMLASCTLLTQCKLSPNIRLSVLRRAAQLSVLIVAIQMIFNYRPAMIGFEQNFTALFLIYLCFVNRGYWKFFTALVGICTLSRGFLVSLSTYLLFSSKSKTIRRLTPSSLWQSLLILVPLFFVSLFFIVPFIEFSSYDNSLFRLFNLFDTSALSRFTLLQAVIDSLSKYWLFGVPSDVYTHSFFGAGKMVHNSFAQMVILYGIPFTIFFLLSLGSLFSITRELRASFIAVFVWGFSLHGVFSLDLLFLVYFIQIFKLRSGNSVVACSA